MLIAWMAYAVLIASIIFGGALAVERIASIWRSDQRFIWLAGLVIAAGAPVVLATRPTPPIVATVVSAPAMSPIESSIPMVVSPRTIAGIHARGPIARAARLLPALDLFLRDAWIIASFALLMLFVRAAIGVRRQRARWRAVQLDGAHVLVAPNVGPAVIGTIRPYVVVPMWALSLDAGARALMLRHESEHIRARDPLLLSFAALMLALFPWNPALWLLARRLRLAIEIDCDRRVLHASALQREYGMLLLTVGARRSSPLPFAMSLAERRPLLEWRIRAMTNTRPHNPRLVSAACIAFALAATTAASRTPHPRSLVNQATPVVATPAPASVAAQASPIVAPAAVHLETARTATASVTHPAVMTRSPAAAVQPTPVVRQGEPIPIEVIRALIAQHYPNVLQGDPSVNTVTFVLDASGNYVLSSTGYRPVADDSARVSDLRAALERLQILRDSIGGERVTKTTSWVCAVPDCPARADSVLVVGRGRGGRGSVGGSADADAVLKRYIADSVFVVGRGSLGAGRAELLPNLVDEKTIREVDVLDVKAGTLGPAQLKVIIVQLKPAGGE